MMRKAPWIDYAGHPIREGDTIRHPSGEEGEVVFMPEEGRPEDQWRVAYGDGLLSRLCLQVGDKGQAVVVRRVRHDPPAPGAPAATPDRRRADT